MFTVGQQVVTKAMNKKYIIITFDLAVTKRCILIYGKMHTNFKMSCGSLEKVMSGKYYNSVMHVHNCQVLERLFIEKYEHSEGS